MSIFRRWQALVPSLVLVFGLTSPGEAQDTSPPVASADGGEIVVTSTYLPDEPVSSEVLSGRVEIITREKIVNSQAQTIPDLLNTLPGVTIRDDGGNRYDYSVSIRGFDKGEDVLVLVDGVKANLPSNNGVDWQAMPDLGMIERIEVIYGPASSIYGEGAQSAVISIITRKFLKENIEVTATAGSYDHHEGRAAFGVTLGENWSLTGFGHINESDGYRINSDADIWNALINLVRVGDDGEELGIQTMISRSKVGAPNAITDTEIRQNGRRFTANPNDFRTVDVEQHRLSYRRNISDWLGVNTSVGSRRSRTQFRSTSRVFGSLNNLKTTSDRTSGQFILSADNDITSNVTNNLVAGVDGSWTDQIDRNSGTFPDNRISNKRSTAAFLENRLDLGTRLTLNAGVRWDWIDLDIDDTDDDSPVLRFKYKPNSFRAGGSWRFADGWKLYTQYGEAFMPPNFADIAAFSGPFSQPNFGLRPEESKTWQGGIAFTAGPVSLDATYFRVTTDNEIAFNSVTFINQNLTKTKREGVELGLNWDISNKWGFDGQYTFIDATIEQQLDNPALNGKAIPMVPEHRFFGTLSYRPTATLTFALDNLYVDDQHVQSDNANSQPLLDSYWVTDLRAIWNFHRNGKLIAAARNLFDEEYSSRAVVSGSAFGAFPSNTIFFSPSPEFNFDVSLQWKF